MSIRAAAVEIDITPAIPCEKPGWITKIIAEQVDDPLCAKVMVLEDGKGQRVALVSVDCLSIRWPLAEAIRDDAERAGVARENVLVGATHTHTGGPVSASGLASKDFAYIADVARKVGLAIKEGVENLRPAEMGFAAGIEARVSFIRRCIMKDGTVKTHPAPSPAIRCSESVIDPEVGVLAIRDAGTKTVMGVMVNFACHPVHGGGEARISAGWPGVLSGEIKKALGAHVPTVFLNGAAGDIHHQNPLSSELEDTNTKERVGTLLASTVLRILPTMSWDFPLEIGAVRETIQVPFRDIDGPVGVNFKLRQRFAPDEIYDQLIARLRAKKAKRDHVLGEIQVIRLNAETALVGLPCEPFSGLGFEIKMRSPFAQTCVVGYANGMIGYIPTLRAFERGGYETTLSMGNKLDPSAARLVVDKAMEKLDAIRI